LRRYLVFQAEEGIRDRNVTGVQMCALPICSQICHKLHEQSVAIINYLYALRQNHSIIYCNTNGEVHNMNVKTIFLALFSIVLLRSEERRVGIVSRFTWGSWH